MSKGGKKNNSNYDQKESFDSEYETYNNKKKRKLKPSKQKYRNQKKWIEDSDYLYPPLEEE